MLWFSVIGTYSWSVGSAQIFCQSMAVSRQRLLLGLPPTQLLLTHAQTAGLCLVGFL